MPRSTNGLICIDASLVVGVIREGPGSRAKAQWQEWEGNGAAFVAPTLLYYELTNALHRYVVHGEMLPDEAARALDIALQLGITLYGDPTLHRRARELAGVLSLPAAYDAHYLALAERLGAKLWTADRRLFHNAERRFPWVHLFEA